MATPRLFVSHSHRDNDWCRAFVEALHALDFDARYDEKGLIGGAQWIATIQRELQSRDVFVIVLTPNAWESDWVQEELQLALAQRRQIVPVLHRPTKVEGFLLNRQWVDVVGQNGESAARRVSAALGYLPVREQAPAQPAPPPIASAPPPPIASAPPPPIASAPPPQVSPAPAPSSRVPSPQLAASPGIAPARTPVLPSFPSIPFKRDAEQRNDKRNVSPAIPARAGGIATSVRQRSSRQITWAAVSTVVVVGLIIGVIAAARHPDTTTQNTPTIVRGGAIVDGLISEPDSLLPELAGATSSYLVDAAMWAPLMYSNGQGVPQAGLLKEVPSAANGDISADGMTYTLKLRSGLKWSDGTPMTSADVKLAADLFSKLDSSGNSLYGASDGWPSTEIASVTATDPLTTIVRLKRVDASFLLAGLVDAATFAPLPTSVYGSFLTDPQKVQTSSNNSWPKVTSGPFTVKDRVAGDHITVARNPNYYLGPDKPYLDQITFKIFTSADVILTGLQTGAIDTLWYLSIDNLTSYQALSGYKVYSGAPSVLEAAHLNLKNAILADRVVRQAMAMSLDPTVLIHTVWHDQAQKTCDDEGGTAAHDTTLIRTDGRCYQYNVDKASQMLDADGWKLGTDGFRHWQGNTANGLRPGETLELSYSITASRSYRMQTAQIVQQAWAKIGLKIDIRTYTASTLFGSSGLYSTDPSKWDIIEFAYGQYDPDTHLSWDCDQTVRNGGSNYGSYCNPQVDQLEKDQLTHSDMTTRVADLHQVEKLLLQDVPLIYLYAPSNLAVATTKLHNYAPSAIGPQETWNVWLWWRDK